jgi:PAS domain S-box-containing protein
MLLVDIRTLLFVTVTTSLVLSLALGMLSRSTGMAPLRLWSVGLLLHALAYTLLSLRGTLPDLLTIVVANAVESAFAALWGLALARWLGRSLHPALLIAPPALTALVALAFIGQPVPRIPLMNIVLCAQILLVLHLLRGERHGGTGHTLLFFSLAATAGLVLLRIVAVVAGIEQIPALTTRTTLQTLAYLTGSVIPVIGSLGFLFMMKERDERQIQESKHVLTTIFDSSDETIAMFDRDGTLLAINRIGAERLGAAPQELVGRNLAAVVPAEVAAARLAAIRRVAASGQSETLVDARAGRTYHQTFYPVEGENRRVVAYATDITEKLAAETAVRERLEETLRLNKKLEEAHNQLLQSEKMASIGQLAAGVAHELNNPIGFVGSNLGTLDGYLHDLFAIADACSGIEEGPAAAAAVARLRQLKADKDYDFLRSDTLQLVTESREGLSRVAKIVKDLKDFSRAGEAVWQWADLHQGLDSTLNIVWNELKYKCTVTKEYGALPQVHCIPSQLNQVFMNLLVNAAHAIPDKGEITIRTGQQGDEVFVAVSDTGAGIAPEILNRIFDPFFTTKPVGKGTGLGLSLSYSIVQKHKGRIEVVSQPGSGTTFTVWLPIDPPTASDPS